MNQPQSLGPLILSRRRQLGRSQERVADLMCEALGRATVTKNEISRYEREERVPTAASLRALATALDLPRAEVESAVAVAQARRNTQHPAKPRPTRTPANLVRVMSESEEEAATERRDVLHSLAAASLAVAGWPVGSRATDYAPRRVTPDHVAEVRESTALYRAWVSRHGGTNLRKPVAALLQRASALHSAASDQVVRQDLLTCIGDLAGLGAYIARDVQAHDDAVQMYRLALSASQAAGDRHLGGHLIVRMAGHNIELRRPEETLGLLGAAQQAARSVLSHGERANQLAIEAWAFAQLGQAEKVRRCVGLAEEQFARHEPGNSRAFGQQHVTEAELFSLTGAAYVDLARRDRVHAATAIERLNRALELRGSAHARNRTLDLVSLAEAKLLAGELKEARRLAASVKAQAADLASPRLRQRVADLHRGLR